MDNSYSLTTRLPENVRRLRKKRGVSMRCLADFVGCSHHYISIIECGGHSPSIEIVARLADYFAVSLDALCGYTPDN